jgi:hypothetical protein
LASATGLIDQDATSTPLSLPRLTRRRLRRSEAAKRLPYSPEIRCHMDVATSRYQACREFLRG